jgi:DNA-binding transcriptional LysR family regulator
MLKSVAGSGEAERQAAGERSVPHGTLTITAPVVAGVEFLRAIVDDFMEEYPTVNVRLYRLDRPVNLIDKGIDLALRISHLADWTLVADPVGDVRRVVVASPHYLSKHPRIVEPADLGKHQIIAMTHFGLDSWRFPPAAASSVPRAVPFTPRFVVNSVRAAASSAVDAHGVTRLFSYHVAAEIKEGLLRVILADAEHSPIPVHLVSPHGRLSVPKVRAFVGFALPRLRAQICVLREGRIEVTSPGDSAATRKNVCRTTRIRFWALQAWITGCR